VVGLPGAEVKNGKPIPLIKSAAKEGETWVVDFPVSASAAETVPMTFTMGAVEDSEVRGLKCKAHKVTGTVQFDRMPQMTEAWYVPNIGEVKSVIMVGKHKMVSELKSFTPGK
jgi:hypothetical protein